RSALSAFLHTQSLISNCPPACWATRDGRWRLGKGWLMTQYLPKGLVECFMGTRGSSSSTMYSYWGGLVLETDTNAASASALAPTPAMERVAELSDVTDPLSLFSETTTNTIDGN